MRAARFFTGPGLIGSGILHFAVPKAYEAIMPDYLPAHRPLVYASGVTELAAGAGSLHPSTRRPAGWLGLATMVGVFPANLHMAMHPERYPKLPRAALYARLPMQLVFMYWIWQVCLRRPAGDPAAV
jgi:uncharacterized membrane protein